METTLKHIIFISQHFGNPKYPKWLTLPDIEIVDLILVSVPNYGGPKTIALSERLQKLNFAMVET